ncbi:unnamed protein product [Brassicogethes aeneus]|uniref:Uncharacterized protein n=1 Tax=Brassicogethes aeneus TaxID=1431903 RepID=A0A9P0FL47_BRAAE|nr:unnamed protein product [Brassicogethes aeneus]
MDLHFIKATNQTCVFRVDYQVYTNFLILSGAIMLGKVLLFAIIMKTRSKILMCFSSILCCLSFLIISEINDSVSKIILSGIIICLYGTMESSLYIKSIEMYPTVIRSTGIGVTRCIGLAFFLIFLYEKTLPVNIILWLNAGLFAGAAILSLLLEDLTKKPMIE